MGDLPTWYAPDGIANIVSFYELIQRFHMWFDYKENKFYAVRMFVNGGRPSSLVRVAGSTTWTSTICRRT